MPDYKTQNSNNQTLAKCAWCSGTGKWNVAPGNQTSCVVCHGKGQFSVNEPAMECRQCRGNGRSDRFNPCLTCAGTGWENV